MIGKYHNLLYNVLKIIAISTLDHHQPCTDCDLCVFAHPCIHELQKLYSGISLSPNGELIRSPSQHRLQSSIDTSSRHVRLRREMVRHSVFRYP